MTLPDGEITSQRPRSHSHAAATLADAPYVAYCLAEAAKLLLALLAKRWPWLR